MWSSLLLLSATHSDSLTLFTNAHSASLAPFLYCITHTHPSLYLLTPPPTPTCHTQTLCLLPPGPGDYLGERCIHSCLPTLHLHTITDPTKAPCLMALLKNLHHVLLDQYQYEEVGVACDGHVMSSDHDASQYFSKL